MTSFREPATFGCMDKSEVKNSMKDNQGEER